LIEKTKSSIAESFQRQRSLCKV